MECPLKTPPRNDWGERLSQGVCRSVAAKISSHGLMSFKTIILLPGVWKRKSTPHQALIPPISALRASPQFFYILPGRYQYRSIHPWCADAGIFEKFSQIDAAQCRCRCHWYGKATLHPFAQQKYEYAAYCCDTWSRSQRDFGIAEWAAYHLQIPSEECRL